MKTISEAMKKNIISQLRRGKSIRKISSNLGISNSTVYRIHQKITKEMTFNDLIGRPRTLSLQQERHLVRMVSSGQWSTATKAKFSLKSDYGIHLTTNGVRSILKRNGLL